MPGALAPLRCEYIHGGGTVLVIARTVHVIARNYALLTRDTRYCTSKQTCRQICWRRRRQNKLKWMVKRKFFMKFAVARNMGGSTDSKYVCHIGMQFDMADISPAQNRVHKMTAVKNDIITAFSPIMSV